MSQSRAFAGRRAGRMPMAARMVLGLLERIEYGSLGLHLPDGTEWMAGHGSPTARVVLHDWTLFGAVLARGDIGLVASFIDGHCSTPSPTDLLDVLVGNRRQLERAVYGRWFGRLGDRIRHLLNRNSRRGSRRNVHAHYDLGNAFYREWLDETMTYSSAMFASPGTSAAGRPIPPDEAALADAQRAKYRRMLDQAQVRAGERILEIGSGWGGFAEIAATSGVRVHGLTLSREQLQWARARLARHADPSLATFALQDYRDAHDPEGYDAIVSIEMFEAVGEAWWGSWFDCVHRNLKPGARAVVQTIVIDDALFERYREGTDFIQQYVFPGGMLPSAARFATLATAHGFDIDDATAFGNDYARTLACWHRRFDRREAEVRAQGFDERFIRTWKFYLAYCEAAFRHRNTDVVQFTLRKRGHA